MIDEEIRDALKVEPSPEFLARVRTRIASEPAPSAWRWSWTVAAGGALAAAAIVAVIWSPIERRPGPGPGSQAKPSAGAAGPEGPALHENSVVSGFSRTVPRNASDTTVRLKPDTTESALLFDHSEMRALQALIAAARNGVTLTPAAAAVPPAPMELEPVTDIVIAPITIDPIAPLSGAEGVRP
jgi:hypothetical protein